MKSIYSEYIKLLSAFSYGDQLKEITTMINAYAHIKCPANRKDIRYKRIKVLNNIKKEIMIRVKS